MGTGVRGIYHALLPLRVLWSGLVILGGYRPGKSRLLDFLVQKRLHQPSHYRQAESLADGVRNLAPGIDRFAVDYGAPMGHIWKRWPGVIGLLVRR